MDNETKTKLITMLKEHNKWLDNPRFGKQADFSRMYLVDMGFKKLIKQFDFSLREINFKDAWIDTDDLETIYLAGAELDGILIMNSETAVAAKYAYRLDKFYIK